MNGNRREKVSLHNYAAASIHPGNPWAINGLLNDDGYGQRWKKRVKPRTNFTGSLFGRKKRGLRRDNGIKGRKERKR